MKRTIICLIAACLCAASFGQERINETYSPDSTKIAYTMDNDLYVLSLPDSTRTRLTFDGSETILNGYASWVYYEEIFGRQGTGRSGGLLTARPWDSTASIIVKSRCSRYILRKDRMAP